MSALISRSTFSAELRAALDARSRENARLRARERWRAACDYSSSKRATFTAIRAVRQSRAGSEQKEIDHG
jgi:hypothetical protein